ncbi:MAG: hypothetical protein ACU841_07960 [Gammaproteobacteria bacterium]
MAVLKNGLSKQQAALPRFLTVLVANVSKSTDHSTDITPKRMQPQQILKALEKIFIAI